MIRTEMNDIRLNFFLEKLKFDNEYEMNFLFRPPITDIHDIFLIYTLQQTTK